MELISLSWTQDQFLHILYFLGSPFFPRGGTQILRDTMTCPIDVPRG